MYVQILLLLQVWLVVFDPFLLAIDIFGGENTYIGAFLSYSSHQHEYTQTPPSTPFKKKTLISKRHTYYYCIKDGFRFRKNERKKKVSVPTIFKSLCHNYISKSKIEHVLNRKWGGWQLSARRNKSCFIFVY